MRRADPGYTMCQTAIEQLPVADAFEVMVWVTAHVEKLLVEDGPRFR